MQIVDCGAWGGRAGLNEQAPRGATARVEKVPSRLQYAAARPR